MMETRMRALITGASQGLGKALSAECASRGMDLIVAALPGSGLSDLAAELTAEWGVSVRWLEGDLLEPETLSRLSGIMDEDDAGLDLLINNAGMGVVGEFLDHSLEYHEKTISLNELALVRIVRQSLPHLRRRAGSAILNVASLGAFFPMPTMPVYSATKVFVLNFSLALREELAGGVGVSVLCPNAIRAEGEVNRYIDSLGFLARFACLEPETIARMALDGVERGRAVIVPGALNRLVALLAPLVPRQLINRTVRHYWGNYQRWRLRETAGLLGVSRL